jgi:hypothetical protein
VVNSETFICLQFKLIFKISGTFLPYDAVNDPLGPQIRGIDAGLHTDGTIAYMGYGFNAADSIRQKDCPGYVQHFLFLLYE